MGHDLVCQVEGGEEENAKYIQYHVNRFCFEKIEKKLRESGLTYEEKIQTLALAMKEIRGK